MFERFLVRLAKFEFKDKFVIKGGMLIAKLVGLDIRSTMDLGTTLIHLLLTETSVRGLLNTYQRYCQSVEYQINPTLGDRYVKKLKRSNSITHRYTHLSLKPVIAAADAVSEKIAELMGI